MARTRTRSSIFFPWEGRRGLHGIFRTGKVRPVFVFCAVIGFVLVIAARERQESGIRETRATLLGARRALDAYLAENDGNCPKNLDEVLNFGTFESSPRDAWGRPLRLVCPGRRQGERYELLSDGPDGKPGGLDRIE